MSDLGLAALMKLAILPMCIFLGGCSTLLTINSGEPYSGVKCDIAGIQKTFDTSSPHYILPHWAEGMFSAIDLPFSLVGDTVVLPYTILQRQKPHGIESGGFSETPDRTQ